MTINNAPWLLVACPVESGYHLRQTHHPAVPSSPFSNLLSPLQSRGHVNCGVVDVGAPCERVELNIVVDDLGAGVGCVHQVEALHLISALA